PVALGRADEIRGGCRRLTVLALEPHEHLECRAAAGAGAGMHDGLVVEFELVVAQRALQLLQPMNFAAVPRAGFLARRIYVHMQAALLLRDVAGGIRRTHEILDRPAALS